MTASFEASYQSSFVASYAPEDEEEPVYEASFVTIPVTMDDLSDFLVPEEDPLATWRAELAKMNAMASSSGSYEAYEASYGSYGTAPALEEPTLTEEEEEEEDDPCFTAVERHCAIRDVTVENCLACVQSHQLPLLQDPDCTDKTADSPFFPVDLSESYCGVIARVTPDDAGDEHAPCVLSLCTILTIHSLCRRVCRAGPGTDC
jgi:hypothetical protein